MNDDQSPARALAAILFTLAFMLGAALFVTSREAKAREAETLRADLARPQAINGAPR